MAKCACDCIPSRGWPYTDSLRIVRDVCASQTATPPGSTLQDSQCRRLYCRWLDNANGLARVERILANPDQRLIYNKRSCYRLPVLYYRYSRSRRRAFLRTTIQKPWQS